ncbi:MAG TPA: phosphoribosylanthranilate isomerase [Williamwhitmania sp.]|nr:phosphoribosylanthranilate isomerase [Williamwhitmania sp.]
MVEAKPDMVGFIFYLQSPRYVEVAAAKALSQTSVGNAQRVGVFVDSDLHHIEQTVVHFGLNAVQLHGSETPQLCEQLKQKGLTVIKTFRVGEEYSFTEVELYVGSCNLFLFDAAGSRAGGNGIPFRWNLLDSYSASVPFLLSGGIGEEHLLSIKALKHPMLLGVDINSRFEVMPGVKDGARVKKFIEMIKSDLC